MSVELVLVRSIGRKEGVYRLTGGKKGLEEGGSWRKEGYGGRV